MGSFRDAWTDIDELKDIVNMTLRVGRKAISCELVCGAPTLYISPGASSSLACDAEARLNSSPSIPDLS